MSKILVCGAGGFIGGHLTQLLMRDNSIVCADIKPMELWFQLSDKNKNITLDLKEYENCLKVTEGVDYIYNLACNMGGMGFIENNKAECMLSVLVNTNLLRACLKNKIKRYYYSSSACVYNGTKQSKTFIPGLKESDAYPADPEDLAPSLSFPPDRQDRRDRGSEASGGNQERHGERAVLYRTLAGQAGHARGAATRGACPARGSPPPPKGRERGKDGDSALDRSGEISQGGRSGRSADHRGRLFEAQAEHLGFFLPSRSGWRVCGQC